MFLSVVIPAYNEENRLGLTLSRMHAYFNKKDYEYEVIVVNNGSTDMTETVALNSSLNQAGRLKLIDSKECQGKGYSVKKGILASRGEYILFSDADLSTPIEEIDKLFSVIRCGFDIAIGSRSIDGSDVRLRQPFYREYMGRMFNVLVQLFIFKGIKDTQCGFKLLTANAAKKIASLLKIDGFAFDVELIYLANKNKYKVKEVPVIWINSPLSKVGLFTDSWRMLKDIFLIKRIHD